ncbi:unnamed protein product, partial [Larinioides sclopetarius]
MGEDIQIQARKIAEGSYGQVFIYNQTNNSRIFKLINIKTNESIQGMNLEDCLNEIAA